MTDAFVPKLNYQTMEQNDLTLEQKLTNSGTQLPGGYDEKSDSLYKVFAEAKR